MFQTFVRDHNLIQMPFVTRGWRVALGAICKVTPKSINPQSNRLATNNDTMFSQEIFDIRRIRDKAVVRLD